MKENKADIFLTMTESLSRYRRADLKNEKNENLIEELYEDPLENDLILKSMLKNNTTLLIGRKGTGKSTIINRFQHEIRKTKNKLSLYIDVKALFEQAKKTTLNISNIDPSLTKENIEKLNLYIIFIKKIISELNKEIEKGLFTNPLISFLTGNGLSKKEFKNELDELFTTIVKPSYQDITSTQQAEHFQSDKNSKYQEGEIKLSGSPTDTIDLSASANINNETLSSQAFTKILTRYFNIIEFTIP